MTSTICNGEPHRDMEMSNMWFYTLLGWALDVSVEIEHPRAAEFRTRYEDQLVVFTASHGWDIHEYLQSDDEAQFWARAFALVAARVFEGALGNQTPGRVDWQLAAIHDAWQIARMLAERVRLGLSVHDVVAWAQHYTPTSLVPGRALA